MEVYIRVIFVLTLTSCIINAFVVVHDAPRKVVKVLSVDNGGRWGEWHGPHFCAEGTYAVGYEMKVPYCMYMFCYVQHSFSLVQNS